MCGTEGEVAKIIGGSGDSFRGLDKNQCSATRQQSGEPGRDWTLANRQYPVGARWVREVGYARHIRRCQRSNKNLSLCQLWEVRVRAEKEFRVAGIWGQ